MRDFVRRLLPALLAFPLWAEAQPLYLACSMRDASQRVTQYSLEFRERESTLYWVEGGVSLRVQRNTATELWASHDSRFRSFEYDSTDFRLNRIAGTAD